MKVSPLRIVATGLIAQHPHLGGMTWHYLQYAVGLARLGHDVYYLEDSGQFPYKLDATRSGPGLAARSCQHHVGYLDKVMTRFGLGERWAYRWATEGEWFGMPDTRRRDVLASADLLLNVSGTLEHPDRYATAERLVYIDTDPVVTQAKIVLGDPKFCPRVAAHDVHFSFGEELSEAVPPTPYRWRPTRQPVLLSEWQAPPSPGKAFTTVMSWTSYAPIRYADRTYGQKDLEFRRFLELPSRVAPLPLEIALGSTSHPEWEEDEHRGRSAQEVLSRAGWRVVDAHETCGDLDRYRAYLQASRGEWSVAKNAYVRGRPGWFSERSACYLASGRPVVVQNTGFDGVLPLGEGIVAFDALDEAAAALREVDADHERHARAAREIAAAYFDSDKVLNRLLEEADGAPRESPL